MQLKVVSILMFPCVAFSLYCCIRPVCVNYRLPNQGKEYRPEQTSFEDGVTELRPYYSFIIVEEGHLKCVVWALSIYYN